MSEASLGDQIMFAGYDSEELDETLEAERDVLGTRTVSEITPVSEEFLSKAFEGMREALAELPVADKEAYDEAVLRSRRVVELETPFQRFLLACNYDYWAAAQRLSTYWTRRREIFGAERYYLPLTLSREGAVRWEVAEIIKSGWIIAMNPDKYNRPVILYDVEKEIRTEFLNDLNVRMQLLFFGLHVQSENNLAVVNGIVVVVAGKMAGCSDWTPFPAAARFAVSETVPVKICGVHFVMLRKPTLLSRAIDMWLSNANQYKILRFRVRLHYWEEEKKIIRDLVEYGISVDHLPQRFGGKASFTSWYEQRCEDELKRYAFLDNHIQKVACAIPPSDVTTSGNAQGEEQGGNLKRKMMDDFRDWADDHLASKKLAQLQTDVNPLWREKFVLQRRNVFLQKQIACAEFIANACVQDLRKIHACLTSYGRSFPGILRDLGGDCSLPFADAMLSQFLFFLGRAPYSGEWMFAATPWLAPFQQQLLNGVKLHLWREQHNMVCFQKRLDDDILADPVELQGSLQSNPHDDQQEDNIYELQINELTAKKERFERQHEDMKTKQNYLESSLYCASYLAERYDDFRQKHYLPLARILDSCFLSLREICANYSSAHTLANHALTYHTSFDGQQFFNPVVDMVLSRQRGAIEQRPATNQQQQLSQMENREALEILMSVYAGMNSSSNPQLLRTMFQGPYSNQQFFLAMPPRPAAQIQQSVENPAGQQEEEKQRQETELRRLDHNKKRKKLLKRL